MLAPAVFGIVNVTPDSFSDGGRLGEQALFHAKTLIEEGADVLDIGAESTRPGATLLSPDEEWARLAPVLEGLRDVTPPHGVRLSVDTRHGQTASRAMELGATIINDQGGLTDDVMIAVVAERECDVVVMHSLGLPADPSHTWPADISALSALLQWKEDVIRRAAHAGIGKERLIFDPGLGFGKTPLQSLRVLMEARALVASGGRWLFGHSRKSFLTLFADAPPAERDGVTLALSLQLADAGVPYLRVHNVAAHQRLFAQLCT